MDFAHFIIDLILTELSYRYFPYIGIIDALICILCCKLNWYIACSSGAELIAEIDSKAFTQFVINILNEILNKMSQIWLATVPNNKDHPDKTYAAIQSVMTASSYSKMSRVDVPNLVVGTLDTLMSLADDMTKIGTIVEVFIFNITFNFPHIY